MCFGQWLGPLPSSGVAADRDDGRSAVRVQLDNFEQARLGAMIIVATGQMARHLGEESYAVTMNRPFKMFKMT